MKQNEDKIKRELKKLRTLIENNEDDPVLSRIAYEMETAIRWATEDTTGWPSPREQAISGSKMLKSELENE